MHPGQRERSPSYGQIVSAAFCQKRHALLPKPPQSLVGSRVDTLPALRFHFIPPKASRFSCVSRIAATTPLLHATSREITGQGTGCSHKFLVMLKVRQQHVGQETSPDLVVHGVAGAWLFGKPSPSYERGGKTFHMGSDRLPNARSACQSRNTNAWLKGDWSELSQGAIGPLIPRTNKISCPPLRALRQARMYPEAERQQEFPVSKLRHPGRP